MKLSNKRLRNFQRVVHFIGAALIGTYVYSPWGVEPVFSSLTKYVVIPL